MNRKEIVQILAVLRANYPNVKIDNPSAMAKTWEMVLGEFSSAAVTESVKCHMSHSKFFPTPAEIRENIVRHKIVLEVPTIPRLGTGKKAKCTAIPDGMSEKDFLDALIEDQIALETEMEKNRNNGFLDFER